IIVPGVDDPVLGGRRRAGGTGEVVAPHWGAAGRGGGWRGGGGGEQRARGEQRGAGRRDEPAVTGFPGGAGMLPPGWVRHGEPSTGVGGVVSAPADLINIDHSRNAIPPIRSAAESREEPVAEPVHGPDRAVLGGLEPLLPAPARDPLHDRLVLGDDRDRHVPARARSEERRVGKECRSRWSPEP